jgi:hypothetical protein
MAEEPTPVADSTSEAYFPYEYGDRLLYYTYYASRQHGRRHGTEEALWKEVVAENTIHGFNVFILQNQHGEIRNIKGTWTYDIPEEIKGEEVYAVTSLGVALMQTYTLPKSTFKAYRKHRNKLLNKLRRLDRDEFTARLQNWILPFPVKAGQRREAATDPGFYYKILRGGSKAYVPRGLRAKTIGAAGFAEDEWSTTRWFTHGKGLLVHESHHSDAGVDSEEFPFKVRALFRAFKAEHQDEEE